MITSKENGYIYVLILLSFILLTRFHERKFDIAIGWDFKKVRMLVVFSLILLLIFVPLYTAGFSDEEGLERATVGAFSHWVTMHEKKDHWKPIYYYANILFQYEFLPLALAITSIPVFLRRLKSREATKIELFAAYWLFSSFLVYHVLSHKVPWLVVHLVAPLAFFGAMYSSSIFAWNNRAYRFAFLLISIATLMISLHVTYVDYDNAEEDLIYIQIQPSAVELSKIIASKLDSGEKITIYEPKNDYWPLPWYLRNYTLSYRTKWVSADPIKADYIVTSEREKTFVEEQGYKLIGRYEIRPHYFMVLMVRS
jgi:uncharacterized protein (TIGR03663 family)